MPKSKTKKKSIFSLETDESEIDMCVNNQIIIIFNHCHPCNKKQYKI